MGNTFKTRKGLSHRTVKFSRLILFGWYACRRCQNLKLIPALHLSEGTVQRAVAKQCYNAMLNTQHHVDVHAAYPCPCCTSMSMPRPCCMFISMLPAMLMLHAHAHAACPCSCCVPCPCPCCMSMLWVHRLKSSGLLHFQCFVREM